MQNILLFIFRMEGGGAERVVSNLTIDLEGKYNIKIVTYDIEQRAYFHKGELIPVKLPFSENPADNNWWKRLVRLILLIKNLRKIKKEHQIDTTISFGEQANIVNILTAGNRKTVLSVRTLLSTEIRNTPKMRVIRRLVRMLYNRADHIIVPSKLAGLDLVKHFNVLPDKLKVIYNYTNREKVSRLAAEMIENPDYLRLFEGPVLLNVGRINPSKGQWLLLKMMEQIKKEHPSWKLVIIGKAEKRETLKAQLIAYANELSVKVFDNEAGQPFSLDYDVYLLGFQSNPYQFMRHSRVLLFPSVFEGFPNTVLEAMQAGLPVIASDCHSGPREIMAPESELTKNTSSGEYTKYGILCPVLSTADIRDEIEPQVTREWLNALQTMMGNEELRNTFIQNGYRRVPDFDKVAILQQWEESMTDDKNNAAGKPVVALNPGGSSGNSVTAG